jgi:hypothetical protein
MRDQRTSPGVPANNGTQDPNSPAMRALRARLAAFQMHARYDARQTTAKARAVFLARFEQEADPDGVLTPQERARRAAHFRSAYFARLALASARARRSKRDLRSGMAGGDSDAA